MLSAACASAWKSTCAVRSTWPGAASGSAKSCAPTACSVSPVALSTMAVVDHQRGAVGAHHAAAELERDLIGAPFEDLADLRRSRTLAAASARTAGSGRGRERTQVRSSSTLTTRSCQPSAHMTACCTGSASKNSLARMIVGPLRHLVERSVPLHRQIGAGERLPLALLQRRADLDQMHHDRRAEGRHDLRGAQRVEHHGAAAGAKLDQAHILRRAHLPPDRGGPQPDQLAEHLADLGRGDEVAVGAERVARHVVAVVGMGEAQRHELPDRHRAGAAMRRRISASSGESSSAISAAVARRLGARPR